MSTKQLLTDLIKSNNIELNSTHGRLCFPVIERIFKKMTIGIHFQGIKVEGKTIVDGHHRYLASLMAGIELEQHPSFLTNAKKIHEWQNVIFDENDWDTEAKILILNQQDAEFNNIDLEQLLSLMK